MFKVGFGKKCITPPMGTPMVGYYEERLSKGVLDDLFVRAAGFDDGEKKALVITVDVCLMRKLICDELRERISKECGLDFGAVFISASHTHTGPVIIKDFASDRWWTEEYAEFFKSQIVEASKDAINNLAPARLFTAEKEVKGISFIRRFRMKDGSVATNPGIQHPDIDHPLGTPDEMMRMLKIVREGARDLFIVNFGTHCDTVSGEYISADYPAYLVNTVERAIDDTDCMFILGPQGDVNHFNVDGSNGGWKLINDNFGDSSVDAVAHARHMGRCIAGAVLSVCALAKEVKTGEISFGRKEVNLPAHKEDDKLEEAKKIAELYDAGRHTELPYDEMALVTVVANARRIVRLHGGPDYFEFYVHALKIGDFVFACFPGEPFTDIGRRVYANSPFKNTMVTCLTNDTGGYFPTSSAFSEGGYEASSCSIAAGSDDVLVEGMLDLLDELK